MPAMNPGNTAATSNPSTGKAVLMNPFSGPLGSPFDRDTSGNASTGALNTGIGFGLDTHVAGKGGGAIADMGVALNYIPGVTKPDGNAATNATYVAIGGGRCNAAVITAGINGAAVPNPYAVQALGAFGNGAARDGGAGPTVFQAYGMKLLTAGADVADGAVISTGFENRSGAALKSGYSQFSHATAANSAVA